MIPDSTSLRLSVVEVAGTTFLDARALPTLAITGEGVEAARRAIASLTATAVYVWVLPREARDLFEPDPASEVAMAVVFSRLCGVIPPGSRVFAYVDGYEPLERRSVWRRAWRCVWAVPWLGARPKLYPAYCERRATTSTGPPRRASACEFKLVGALGRVGELARLAGIELISELPQLLASDGRSVRSMLDEAALAKTTSTGRRIGATESVHGIRGRVLAPLVVSALALSGFGILLSALAALGELETANAFLGLGLLVASGLLARFEIYEKLKTKLELAEDGVAMSNRQGTVMLRWDEIAEFNVRKAQLEVVALELSGLDGKRITLTRDFTQWDVILRTLEREFGVHLRESSKQAIARDE